MTAPMPDVDRAHLNLLARGELAPHPNPGWIGLLCNRCGIPFRAKQIVRLGPCCRRGNIDEHAFAELSGT